METSINLVWHWILDSARLRADWTLFFYSNHQRLAHLAMKIRLKLGILIIALVSLLGCSTGSQWYYPYGPSYFGQDVVTDEPLTPSGFISRQRPK